MKFDGFLTKIFRFIIGQIRALLEDFWSIFCRFGKQTLKRPFSKPRRSYALRFGERPGLEQNFENLMWIFRNLTWISHIWVFFYDELQIDRSRSSEGVERTDLSPRNFSFTRMIEKMKIHVRFLQFWSFPT